MWPELTRVLRKNGSAAFWVRVPTSESLLTQSLLSLALHLRRFTHSSASPVIRHSHRINAYAQGLDPLHSVGPYWQQPGRSIMENHLVQVPEGNEVVPGAFKDFERVFFTGPS